MILVGYTSHHAASAEDQSVNCMLHSMVAYSRFIQSKFSISIILIQMAQSFSYPLQPH